VERPHRHLDREAEEHSREHDQLEAAAEPVAGRRELLERDDVERPGPVDDRPLEVHRQEPQQHEDAAEQRVEEELDRRVLAVRAPPDPDQEVHRYQHELPEDEEQHQVERNERAGHAGLQQELQSQERLRLAGLRHEPPCVDRAQERQHEREDEQRHADPVDPDVVPGPDRRDPFDVHLVLEPAPGSVVEPDRDRDRGDHRRARDGDAQATDRLLLLARDERDDDRAHEGQERGDRDGPVLPRVVHRSLPLRPS
jgi:hypothetical protein